MLPKSHLSLTKEDGNELIGNQGKRNQANQGGHFMH